jgi:uncharacterized protein YfdQ (DUF2303 family)
MENPEQKTVSQIVSPLEVAELAQRAAVKMELLEAKSPDGVLGQFAVLPVLEASGRSSVRLESIAKFFDEYREKPRRRVGTANLADLSSLIDHVNRFKDPDSLIFADTDREHPSMTAVLDYNRQGAAGDPRFGQHRSRYAFPVSDAWKSWTGASGEGMDQATFAEFIETHLVDAIEPSLASESAKQFAEKNGVTFATPSRLLELSRGLSFSVGHKIAQTINLQSGEKQIQFTEEHSDQSGAPLKVPGAFIVGIPVFRADVRYQVCVRLRYRKNGGGLTWFMELWRHDEVFDAAILQACEVVKAGTGLPLLVGTPE